MKPEGKRQCADTEIDTVIIISRHILSGHSTLLRLQSEIAALHKLQKPLGMAIIT
jgi:hypothetical protein